uniref:Uncharacterized protein n=1 Tax=Arundo donax TaxID=35708 RepID=A0A0A9I2D9_ARUDO
MKTWIIWYELCRKFLEYFVAVYILLRLAVLNLSL